MESGGWRRQTDRSSSLQLQGSSFWRMAERVGFEPTRTCALPLFESGTFNHSDTSPITILGRGPWPRQRGLGAPIPQRGAETRHFPILGLADRLRAGRRSLRAVLASVRVMPLGLRR